MLHPEPVEGSAERDEQWVKPKQILRLITRFQNAWEPFTEP
jgi:hypothetical protein